MHEMSEVPTLAAVYPSEASPQPDGAMEAELRQEIGRLLTIIHNLTGPEAPASLEHATLVHNLGTAAYHLALAREQLQNYPAPAADTETVTELETVWPDPDVTSLRPVGVPEPAPEIPADTPEPEPAARTETAEPSLVDEPVIPASAMAALANPEVPVAEPIANTDTHAPESHDDVARLAAELGLKDRQALLFGLVFSAARQGQWFRKGDIDLASVGFVSESARGQAWVKLAAKLTSAGVLESVGERYGRQYRLTSQFAESADTASPDPKKNKSLPRPADFSEFS